LNFGSIAPGAQDGIVTVAAFSKSRTATGVNGPSLIGTSFSSAKFDVFGGEGSAAISFGKPDFIDVSSETSSMRADLNYTYPEYLNSDGTAIVSIGGDLHVGAYQEPGDYTATFEVSVFYY